MTWTCAECPAPIDNTEAALAHHDATGHHVQAPPPSVRDGLIGALEVLADEVGMLSVWATNVAPYLPLMSLAMQDRAADLRNRCAAIRTLLERT
jgi:hypothetical protein